MIATIVAPIRELVGRLGPMALPVLLLVAGFRMPGYVSSVMAVPLFKSLHYSNTDIATVTKLVGFWVALAATFLGGWMVPRLGTMASLVVGTVAGSLVIAVIQYGLVFIDVEPFWQFVAVGVVIIISVLVDQTQRKLGGER